MRADVPINRRDRRAALKLGRRVVPAAADDRADAFNRLGLVAQASGRHHEAIKSFAKAVAADESGNPTFHFNIAMSCQAVERREKAFAHFSRAIALGLEEESLWRAALQAPALAGGLLRIKAAWPRLLTARELFGASGIADIAKDTLLTCLLKSFCAGQPQLEHFLTRVRFFLLEEVMQRGPGPAETGLPELAFYSALAQQCFINEYVFGQTEAETRQAAELRDMLDATLAAGGDIAPLPLIAVAAYYPLHTLANTDALLQRQWPAAVDELVQQQIHEPRQEWQDRQAIPALTPIGDGPSSQVRRQYEENPYPRWTVLPQVDRSPAGGHDDAAAAADILVAGCGTGKHAIDVALEYPRARVLAADLSLAALAYARRKTRAFGIRSIHYAQADILALDAYGRDFDRIEAVGVLHHLSDPHTGWRVLLTRLRPGGIMRVGLYSEIARRSVIAGRALIAQRGYPPTVDGIRACRQEIFRCADGTPEKDLTTIHDFYSASGCRDLLFHVMEHRFTLPQIKAFLAENNLTLLRFVLKPAVVAAFCARFRDPGALTDLDCWHQFESDNPATFLRMYEFEVRKSA